MLTIAWDVDDVLNDFMNVWYIHKWLPEHPQCNTPFVSLVENPPHQLLGCSKEEYLASLDEFRLSTAFQNVKPVAEILRWFVAHGSKAHHVALTAVPSAAAHVSGQWVMRHFGAWMRTFHFIPSYRKNIDDVGYDKSKVDYIKRTDIIDVLVEDNPDQLIGLDGIHKQGLLIPRPWNRAKRNVGQVLAELTKLVEGKE